MSFKQKFVYFKFRGLVIITIFEVFFICDFGELKMHFFKIFFLIWIP